MRNNDPYYLGNDTELPTRLTLQTTSTTIQQDVHWDASLRDVIYAFYTAAIGIGFAPESVIGGMKEFAEEYTEQENEQ